MHIEIQEAKLVANNSQLLQMILLAAGFSEQGSVVGRNVPAHGSVLRDHMDMSSCNVKPYLQVV